MIDPKRSKYKKETKSYRKEGAFDIIDIQECIDKNKFIPKIAKNLFIFEDRVNETANNQIYNFENKNSNKSNKFKVIDPEESYRLINKNKFGFKVEDLVLEYSNGYQIRLVEKYIPIDLLGEGAFSTVISAFDKSKKMKIAIKIIVKSHKSIKNLDVNFDNEMKIHLKLDHPNVVKLYEVLDNEDFIYMFMELMNGGTLQDLIIERYRDNTGHLFRDNESSTIIKGILEGLNYIHGKNVMHRDIKPENVLFKIKNDLPSLKIGDFGLASQTLDKENLKCGTLIYMAPETISKKTYDCSVDIWACGIILYILCSGGSHPIYTREMKTEDYLAKISKQDSWTFPDEFPLLARNLFFKMCKFNIPLRYEAYNALRHPWVTRSANSQIPETLIESYSKFDLIYKFKAMLSAGLFFFVFKAANQSLFSKVKEKMEVSSGEEIAHDKIYYDDTIQMKKTVSNNMNKLTKSFTVPHSDSKRNLPKIILSGVDCEQKDSSINSGNLSNTNFHSKFKYSPESTARQTLNLSANQVDDSCNNSSNPLLKLKFVKTTLRKKPESPSLLQKLTEIKENRNDKGSVTPTPNLGNFTDYLKTERKKLRRAKNESVDVNSNSTKGNELKDLYRIKKKRNSLLSVNYFQFNNNKV